MNLFNTSVSEKQKHSTKRVKQRNTPVFFLSELISAGSNQNWVGLGNEPVTPETEPEKIPVQHPATT